MPAAPPDVDDDAPPVRTRVRRRRSGRSWAKRKHLGWITTGTVVVVLVLGLVVVLTTWDHGRAPLAARVSAVTPGAPSPTASGSTTATTARTSPSTAKPAQTAVRGTIEEVGDSRFTIKTTTALTYTVIVTGTTKFARNRTFGSYGTGDTISVRGALSAGVITATTVTPVNAR